MDSKDCEYTTKLSFVAQWHDYDSDFTKKLRLSYFPYDDTVELYDLDAGRIFLRRTVCEGVHQKDLFLGNRISVFGRQLEIKDYVDCFTEKLVGRIRQHTFVILKQEVLPKMGDVITEIGGRLDFQICRMRLSHLTRKEAMDFYKKRKGDVHLPFVIENIISGPILVMELVGEDAVRRFKCEVGNLDPEVARKEQPDSLRARYGFTRATNAFHVADSVEDAVEESAFFFSKEGGRKPPKLLAKFDGCTCCVVKPHAIAEGKLGRILSSIIESGLFEISGLQMVYLSNPDAEEFLEVYKGVVGDFNALLLGFLNGPSVVLEIRGAREDLNAHQEFRRFTGPSDSDIARQIRPKTLRGLYGFDKYKNAVHCTDLPEDTVLELEYFFKESN